MSVSRPPRLAVGEEVVFGDATYVISVLSGTEATLTGVQGGRLALPLVELFADAHFAVVGRAAPRAPLPPRGVMEGLGTEVVDKAQWWERHLLEILSGAVPGEVEARSGGDLLRRSQRQREIDKVAELTAQGHFVPLSTLQRMRRRYQAQGLLGLVDGRVIRSVDSRVDERVSAAIAKAVAGETDRSTGTVTRLRRRVEQILRTDHGVDPAAVMPPKTTFYRLVERVSAGQHTFGSAPTRRSLAQQPDGPFGAVAALRPGELMQIDSTPLDVRVILDDGTVDRAELTWMVDVASRTIAAGVLRPTTKSVDASLLLARALTPEPMRPGWTDALRMSRSVLPYRRLVDIDTRLEQAAARPVIVPETIVCDNGMVYLSQTFRTACRAMGINFQATHTRSPWEKGIVERSFDSVATLFAQYAAGYVGRSVDRRGKNAEKGAVWSITELQDLLDEWIVAHWQNRPHDGLRHALTPGKALTPNEQYAALIEVAGYVSVPLSGDDYLELLPATWRVINSYGIKINHRTYDSEALNPYRRQPSGITGRKSRWEVHYDPYDVTRVWVRNHHDGGWITVGWTHLRGTPTPFGEQAWEQAQQILARRGDDPVTEAEIADAVTTLLDKAEQGPDAAAKPTAAKRAVTKRDRRVAARTRATAEPSWPRPVADASDDVGNSPGGGVGSDADAEEVTGSTGLAQVIPLGVFDARAEAKKWW